MRTIHILSAVFITLLASTAGPAMADPLIQLKIGDQQNVDHRREHCDNGHHYSPDLHHCVRDMDRPRDHRRHDRPDGQYNQN